MSFVSSKPDPYPTPVDVVVYLISAIMNRVIKRFYCIYKPLVSYLTKCVQCLSTWDLHCLFQCTLGAVFLK